MAEIVALLKKLEQKNPVLYRHIVAMIRALTA